MIEALFEGIVMHDEMKSCNVVVRCNGSLEKRDSLFDRSNFGHCTKSGRGVVTDREPDCLAASAALVGHPREHGCHTARES